MKKIYSTILIFCLSLLINQNILAQDIPARPNPMRLVNDYAKILNDDEISKLEQKLVAYDNSTGTQICIVTTNSIGEMDITQYADEIGMKWGIGQKGQDNGIVIVVLPKTGNTKGQARISVGYGLEAVIPDATAGQIVDYDMIESFKQNKYYEGLDNGINTIQKFASGEFKPGSYKKMHKQNNTFMTIFPIIIIVIVFILMSIISRKKGSHISSGGGGSFWLLTALLMSMGNRGGGSGGDWGGGSSGGDFGGFGGGDFGGGGASGDW